ncbi:Uncharacterised protein [Vibrio cholerae]|uniref:Uncharacterized protein n=1 Tax=Vibrio cholerae TaxID=666 RepID=A0A655WIB7_VIBCL|nr:Uncharacterised protein [Vibrio cholerae]
MYAHFHVLSNFRRGQHGTDWETATERFCGRQNIWRHTNPLVGIEITGTAVTRLHFIKNQ